MNPLQVTNLCSTRRGTLWSRRRRKGDTNRSWRSSTATATSALRLWLRRRQRLRLQWQLPPIMLHFPQTAVGRSALATNACGTNARHKGQEFSQLWLDSLRLASTCCDVAAAAQWNWSISRSTLASRCINKISYIYLHIQYIVCTVEEEKLKVIVTFWAWQRRKRVCLHVWG